MGKKVKQVRFYPGGTVIEYEDGDVREIKSSYVGDPDDEGIPIDLDNDDPDYVRLHY